jgi:hypothetical protein
MFYKTHAPTLFFLNHSTAQLLLDIYVTICTINNVLGRLFCCLGVCMFLLEKELVNIGPNNVLVDTFEF